MSSLSFVVPSKAETRLEYCYVSKSQERLLVSVGKQETEAKQSVHANLNSNAKNLGIFLSCLIVFSVRVAIFRLYLPPLHEELYTKIQETAQIFKLTCFEFFFAK